VSRVAVLAAAVGLVAGAAGCGDSNNGSQNTIGLPTVTAPAITATQGQPANPGPAAGSSKDEGAQRPAGQAGTDGTSSSCPAGLSKSACRALTETKGGSGGSGAPVQCTPQMSPEACDVLKQISGSSPGGSGEKVPGCNGVSREECLALIQQIAGG
jgi:hypothetical protein